MLAITPAGAHEGRADSVGGGCALAAREDELRDWSRNHVERVRRLKMRLDVRD